MQRRAFSFLEAVASMAMLGVLAASLLSGVSYVHASQTRMRHELACAELANRLIVSWLHDPIQIEQSPDIIAYDGFEYRWELSAVQGVVNVVRPPRDEDDRRTGQGRLDGFSGVECRVWHYDTREGNYGFPGNRPSITLRRIISSTDPLTNPNTAEYTIENDDLLQRYINQALTGSSSGTNTRGSDGERLEDDG